LSPDTLCRACIDAANAAAQLIAERSRDRTSLTWEVKSRADFVTDVDRGAEERLTAVLRRHVPEAVVVGEEFSPTARWDDGIAFIADPLDGTTNFLHGYPQYSVSIAAAVDGVVVAAAVADITRAAMYSATRGGGAFANGGPLRVSTVSDPERSLIGTGFPFKHHDLAERYMAQFVRVMRATSGIRRAGSAALDLVDVAAGRLDAFWESRLSPWDMAAGMLLVREAGGWVTDEGGTHLAPAHGPVVASNGLLHPWLLEQLNG
jgi:myo-inositol-1(or 4)-monophosphatase